MGKTVIYEDFKSIYSLIETLESRKNNEVMKHENSSESGGRSFTGTNSYKEALNLLHNGYIDILEQVKQKTKDNMKINILSNQDTPKVKNMPIGYCPNVPNAIMNLPNSMINIQKEPLKRKTISITYSIDAPAMVNQDDIIKAGVALISAINVIEKKGIRTELKIGFMPSEEIKEITFPTVHIKNYQQKFNLQKICFPLGHPSMLRRIGFKWLETNPKITDSGFKLGYGGPIKSLNNIKKELHINDIDSFIISYDEIKKLNFEIKEILKSFKII